ncbi:hypothetical protein SBY92_003517 [Candida maltosa Xu316]|uniref:Uncharacterized protein n=1 Tax=Candida maltosa (strain Xu316) TaxID=1245528 RepID=M3JTP2_CANMX|nr:hypothetical protein G210_4080 [Candida maltosa Xu316]
MNKLVTELTCRKDHQVAICSLYRSLLRKSQSIKQQQTNIPHSFNKYEILFNIRESFRKEYNDTEAILKQITKGIELDGILERKDWDGLMRFVEVERKEVFESQQRRASYLENQDKVNKRIINAIRGKEKSIAVSQTKRRIPYKVPDLNTISGQHTFIRDGLSEAKGNGSISLKMYLKELQKLHKFPDPKLLPYTWEFVAGTGDTYEAKHIVMGLTDKSLKSYDQDIMQSIIIPDMEYKINRHYLDKLKGNIDEKGPFKAAIKETFSGVTRIPYVVQSTKHKVGRMNVAQLVKEQIYFKRMTRIWDSPTDVEEENVSKDGSYSVKGSKGLGPEENVYPRRYYQQWTDAEELYEVLLEINKNLLANGSSKITNFDQFYWNEALDVTSEYLAKSFQKSLAKANKDISEVQKNIQAGYDESYNKHIEKYQKLIEKLGKYKVFKHSDLVTPSNTSSIYENLPKRSIDSFPITDRIGKGKALADFMRDEGMNYLEYGQKFVKKCTQIMIKISKEK